MPSFSSLSSIRVASQDHVLRLKITHDLVHGSPSDAVHSIKGRLSKELDVLWLSDIFISLSGSLDGHPITAQDMVRSGLMHHFRTQLKANADRLGLNNVSRPFVDDADGLSKRWQPFTTILAGTVPDTILVTLTPSRPLPDASRPHANLVSLHLAYTWRTVTRRNDIANSGHLVEDTNPFSPTLFLPSEALLHRVTEQFLIYHLVSRYPLIFGPWCKRLDLEMQYFPSISHSIVEIMARSKNHRFLSKCTRLLKIARRQHKFVLQTAAAALSSCTDNTGTSEEDFDGLSATPVLTDEQILCECLEQLFRMGVPKRRFKPVAKAAPQSVSFPQDDDDSLLQCIPDAGIDGEASWTELPEIAMSPDGLVAGDYEMLPEDFDVFAQEDWFEGGMWRLPHHEADAGQGEREFDATLDESLIGGSISLASITTRPAQADPVSLYHHQGVDHREVDPAANGLGDKVSQLAFLEDAGSTGVFPDLAHSPSHGHWYEQVMRCEVESEGFEGLDSWSDGDEMADLDSLLFEADVHPDGPEVTGFEEPLV